MNDDLKIRFGIRLILVRQANLIPIEMLADALSTAVRNDKICTIQNFIGGQFLQSSENKFIDSFNPATGIVWAKVPDSNEKDVELAVAAASAAFPSWSSTSAKERARILNKIADLIEVHKSDFALVESRDQGKPVWLAESVDIPRCVHNFRFFADLMAYETNNSTILEAPRRALNYVIRDPVGVAGLISPWNLPLYLLSFKVAPAIAVGNTVVAKPSELTSVTAWLLCHVFIEAGLPAGVVNLVFGVGPKAGEALVMHPDVPLLSFTGSTLTGQKIMEASAKHCKKLSLEMGGKNAAIIFEDADLSKCIPDTIRSSFLNQGEICLCTSRIYVQKPIIEKFLRLFVEDARNLKVGDPNNPDNKLGALISADHLRKVQHYIDLAEKDESARILCGNETTLNLPDAFAKGYFLRPHVIEGVRDDSPLMVDEIFGPVVCVVPFETQEEVIHRVNASKYGLCASVWSQNIEAVHNTAQRLKVGTVWCNCWLVRDLNMPFGGTKASGIGREGAKDSLDFFTEQKTICLSLN